ncbi:MAG: acetate--CoA ligase family protein [Gammaproteobacteria bacterium]|nr:acetate--CoA ligase family protein [Gammaproteobacteria bacterium]MBV8404217.1 acetate--CoA ligase family protein [Gammaproteobacteria bacterium]
MSSAALQRLLAPRSVALIGGTWADAAQAASRVIGYSGELWRVHPTRPSSPAQHYYRSVDELPAGPDATFIAAPNREVPAIAAALARRGAGGFVCFAAGFSETATEEGRRLTGELLRSAGELPFFGPNCYGLVNFLDGAALWPDQLVGQRRERGVALVCQSGTVALNLLFNDRSLPIGCVLTVGNQTRLAAEDLIEHLCADERISAIGLYLEGLRDVPRFARAAAAARLAGKPLALVKTGRTAASTEAARTHTGALSGADNVFDAFCEQAGIARCESLATLCETLKLLHAGGPLRGRRILAMGASGGDTAMAADAARNLAIEFPPFRPQDAAQLRTLLSERVHISNPFDFHTHIWFDYPKQHAMFSIAQRAGFDLVAFLLDCPPAGADDTGYVRAIEEFAAALPGAETRAAVISSLPESLGSAVREKCCGWGLVPLQGQREALEAIDHAANIGAAWAAGAPLELQRPAAVAGAARSLSEPEAKQLLAEHGVAVPRSRVVSAAEAADAAARLGFPVVIKAAGAALEHKSDVGGVVLNVRTAAEARAAAARLAALSPTLLIEEMVADGLAEILIGMRVDPQFGLLLVLGAGGVLTELLRDSVTLLPPFTAAGIAAALGRLRAAPLLAGFRGRPAADVPALIETALACTRFAAANLERFVELDLNPVIVRPRGRGALAVDALIRLA